MALEGPPIVIVSGARDRFELAAACFTHDPRSHLVTDFYSARRVRGVLRYHSLVPDSQTVKSPAALSLLQLSNRRAVPIKSSLTLRSLAHQRLDRLAATHCPTSLLVTYSTSALGRAGAGRRVVFYHHPPPQFVRERMPAGCNPYSDYYSKSPINVAQDSAWQCADLVICASSFSRDGLLFMGCPEERIAVVPYGFLTSEKAANAKLEEEQLGGDRGSSVAVEPAEGAKLLFVGNDPVRKGLPELVDGLVQLRDKYRPFLTVVSTDRNTERLLKPLGERCTLLSNVARSRLEDLYRQSDVLMLPSHAEGWGLVVLEAMSHGCWVAASDATCRGAVDPLLEATFRLNPGNTMTSELEHVLEQASLELDRTLPSEVAARRTWEDFRQEVAQLLAVAK